MKEARVNRKHAVLKVDKLVIEGRDFDLEFCKKHMGNDRKGQQKINKRVRGPTAREEKKFPYGDVTLSVGHLPGSLVNERRTTQR